jgi:hypothetical protein
VYHEINGGGFVFFWGWWGRELVNPNVAVRSAGLSLTTPYAVLLTPP